MTIIALPAFNDNYIWTIINENNHTLTCIDPGDALPVLKYAQRNHLILTNILITHHHHDHVGGVNELLQTFSKANVYGPADIRIPQINKIVRDEDIVHIEHHAFRVISIPGHTSSHICYQEPTENWLFCGDTLFSAGCGRVFDGTIEQLHHSLQILKNLPKNTQIYCGHEYTRKNLRFALTIEPENPTVLSHLRYLEMNKELCSLPSSIALEKKINPFLRTDSPSLQKFAVKEKINPEDSLAIFKRLRELKDKFK